MNKIKEGLKKVFEAFYGEQWSLLPDAKREEIVMYFETVLNDPKKRLELNYLDHSLESYKSKRWDTSLLILGVLLGVSGNLVANLLDRYFIGYGFTYDVVITAAFLFILFYVYRTFVLDSAVKVLDNDMARGIGRVLKAGGDKLN